MLIGKLTVGLKDAAGVDIVDLNADWTSKWYSIGKFKHLCAQLGWDNNAVQGDLFLDYTCDPDENTTLSSNKNTYNVPGGTDEQMFLDANLSAIQYRLRWEYTSGGANLVSFHNLK